MLQRWVLKLNKNKLLDFKKISIFKGPEDSPGYLLWRVSTKWRRIIEIALKPFDLTHPQFVILATTGWLTKQGAKVSQIEIGQQAGLDPNTTSQILRGLESKELIVRAHSVDERRKHCVLTKKGATRLSKALPAVESADETFFKLLGPKEAGFLKVLQLLVSE